MEPNLSKTTAQKLYEQLIRKITFRKALAVILGNSILGIGAAGLRFSLMGNEPYTASNMAISDGLHMGLGNYQLMINILLLIIQLIFGRSYIGFGSIVNMCFLGYIVQFSGFVMELLLKSAAGFSLFQKLIFMLVSLVILSLGVSMYQTADLGVAPYDYLALGMTDRFPTPYFINRVITDGICVLIIVIAVLSHFLTWETSHLGIGTVLGAFFLGPLINLFTKWNKRWIR
ncbi:MAG TPA: hypothetical protein PLU43_01540 [Lachnospiraceae bacterium]|nr:hypothetical protein [Lachnospiraceae bacterium]